MDLSKTVGLVAIALLVILATGYALGEDGAPAAAVPLTPQASGER